MYTRFCKSHHCFYHANVLYPWNFKSIKLLSNKQKQSQVYSTTCVIHQCTINKTNHAVTVLSGLVNNKYNTMKILAYLENKSKILVCFAPTKFFVLRNCKCFRIFHALVLRRSGTAYLAVIYYFQPCSSSTPNIINGEKNNLKSSVLLKVRLDSVIRSLRVCLLVKTDLLLLTGI